MNVIAARALHFVRMGVGRGKEEGRTLRLAGLHGNIAREAWRRLRVLPRYPVTNLLNVRLGTCLQLCFDVVVNIHG
jgi:hypothetical protein